jgi:cell division protease FtsH
MPEVEEAMIKVIAGPEKKSRVIPEHERKLTAYHEAGHAVVSKQLKTQDPVHQISIIPRGAMGGYTISLPSEDRNYESRSTLFEEIVSLLGGRVAEKLVLNDISTGASNDIQRSSALARKMVTQYGMSDKLGPITFGTGHDEVFMGRDFGQTRNYSESIASQIDDEIKSIIDEAYKRCESILKQHIDIVHAIAEYLLKNETMDAETFQMYFKETPKPSIFPEPGGGMTPAPAQP